MAYLHDSRRSNTEKGKEQKDYEQGYVSLYVWYDPISSGLVLSEILN